MPGIPATWLEEFTVNLTTSGFQDDPDIIQLANGNILVCWHSNADSGAGANPGFDIIGQIFDPLGNRIGGEITLNNAFGGDNEMNADLAALPGGGFVVVYEDVDANGTSIRLEEYDADGASVSANTTVALDDSDFVFRDPRVAVSSATSVLVVYGLASSIIGQIYDPTTNTYGGEISIMAPPDGAADPDVTVLSNGNYVVTGTLLTPGDNAVVYRILSPTGANVLGFTRVSGTEGNGLHDTEASVTALAGGGFVIAFVNRDGADDDIVFRVYDAAGTEIVSGSAGDSGATDYNNEPVVSGLADGSFVIVYDNESDDQMEVHHFSAAGAFLGSASFSGVGSAPSITDLGDGRFAVAWWSASTEVQMEILDTRDFVNDPGVYSPDQWQIGTIGDDVFTADGVSEFVHGHDGNDAITEDGQIRSYYGGNGNDTLIVVSPINADFHDGGDGNDTIDWSGSSVTGATFDLQAGTASNGVNTETMINFENLVGTANADVIMGSVGDNVISGGGGADTVHGGDGNDTITAGGNGGTYYGDADNDTMIAGSFTVYMYGGTGIDTVDFSAYDFALTFNMGTGLTNYVDESYQEFENVIMGDGTNTVTGTDGANQMTGGAATDNLFGRGGADVLDGGAGVDHLYGGLGADQHIGGTGLDFARYDDANYGNLTIRLDNPALNVGAAAVGDTYVDIECLVAGAGNDTVVGNDLANRLFGQGGTDTIHGRNGNDILDGGDGNDHLYGGLGADQHIGGAGIDFARYDDANYGNLTIRLDNPALNVGAAAVGDTYVGIECLVAGAGNDTVVGDNLANRLFGQGGTDTILGRDGNDILDGGAGNDHLSGGLGADQHIGGAGLDFARYDDANYGDLTIRLDNPALNVGAAAVGDTYNGIEGVVGGAG
ncbi:MAG: calcium-binding protein, partial [Rhizobiaceae bacterium]